MASVVAVSPVCAPLSLAAELGHVSTEIETMGNPRRVSDYPTCNRCYATLFVECGENDPAEVTARLKLQPTRAQVKGERVGTFSKRIHPFSAWFLSSRDHVTSQDLRRHLDWLFDTLSPRESQIRALRGSGCVFRVWCYWLSQDGHGGPMFSVPQIQKLSEFEFELCLDVYFLGAPEAENEARNSLSDEAP